MPERKYDIKSIRQFMINNVENYVDECGEVNCTGMVEDWDRQRSTGMETMDMDHPAWDIAVKVAENYEKRNKR